MSALPGSGMVKPDSQAFGKYWYVGGSSFGPSKPLRSGGVFGSPLGPSAQPFGAGAAFGYFASSALSTLNLWWRSKKDSSGDLPCGMNSLLGSRPLPLGWERSLEIRHPPSSWRLP